VALALVCASWLRTEGGIDNYVTWGWTLDDVSFRVAQETPFFPTSGLFPLARADLHGEAFVPRSNLQDADLRWADAPFVSLNNANLSGARMTLAQLTGAQLEGASLRSAELRGAIVWDAHLQDADLSGANLRGAELWQADLRGADLSSADMFLSEFDDANLERADLSEASMWDAVLSGAHMDGTNLQSTDLRSADWQGTSIGASPAHSADLRGAKNLTQAQIEDVIGDKDTLLPIGNAPDTGAPYFIWSCWMTPPDGFDALVQRFIRTRFESAEHLRRTFLCSPGNPRRKLETGMAVDAPRPPGHPLGDGD
jgi:uncharacterized protein YjbI with pentapeptide repeats